MSRKFVVAICGASGAVYGVRLLRALVQVPVDISLIVSEAGQKVLQHEMGYQGDSMLSFLKQAGVNFHEQASLKCYEPSDLFAPPASGSFRHEGMVIAPCSMRTLANISSGIAENLIHRAADVCLKEKRPLILLPREMPLSRIHLKNMCRAAAAGATIIPPSPSFYFHPQSIEELVDTVVARVLDHLHVEHQLSRQWGEPVNE